MEPTAQPPASVPPSSPAPAPEPPTMAKALGLAGVIIIVLIGGYFVWAWSAPAWPFEPEVGLPTPSASPTADPMAGWQSYSNSEYGFSLKFPPSWSQRIVTSGNEYPLATGWVDFLYAPNASVPEQRVLIVMYTPQQWEALMKIDQPRPVELGRSPTYVFATPFRYEYSGLPGESDIPAILETFKAAPAAVACPADAMMCPDGSYVGRSGPNCEFVCP